MYQALFPPPPHKGLGTRLRDPMLLYSGKECQYMASFIQVISCACSCIQGCGHHPTCTFRVSIVVPPNAGMTCTQSCDVGRMARLTHIWCIHVVLLQLFPMQLKCFMLGQSNWTCCYMHVLATFCLHQYHNYLVSIPLPLLPLFTVVITCCYYKST